MNRFKKGDKVLVRVMECTSKEYDQWDVVYKTGTIEQENILDVAGKKLCTVNFSNGDCDHVWTTQFCEYPKEWVDR